MEILSLDCYMTLICKEYKREDKEKTCLNWNDAVIKRDGSNVQNGYRKEFVSTNMKIDFTTMGTTSDRFMTVNLPSGDKCEELSDRVAAVIEKLIKEKTIKISNDEEHGPSRVVVFDENENVDFENQYNDVLLPLIILAVPLSLYLFSIPHLYSSFINRNLLSQAKSMSINLHSIINIWHDKHRKEITTRIIFCLDNVSKSY